MEVKLKIQKVAEREKEGEIEGRLKILTVL